MKPLVILSCLFVAALPGAAEDPILWYSRPADNWLEALPIGNGRMGAMVFGGVTTERVQFNEQTLWSGTNRSQGWLDPEARDEGTRDGAMGEYLPFGDVLLVFPEAPEGSQDYRRELNLRTAIVTTRYRSDGVLFEREVFASHPDRVVVMRLTASRPGRLSFRLALKDVPRRELAAQTAVASEEERQLSFAGRLSRPSTARAGDLRWNDLAFCAALRVLPEGGRIFATKDEIAVEGADAVTVLLAAATDYDSSPRRGFRGEQPSGKVMAALEGAARKSYQRLRADHVGDYRALFDRVSLDLGDHERSASPTDRRLEERTAGVRDRALEALLFQFARYLAIGSARPGGLPANLQGIWNANPNPAWYSGYTHNINVQMNHWLTETANLPECAEPLFDWIENIALGTKLNPDPRLKTELGWIMYSTHNPLGGNSGWALHLPGSAWLSQHFWEHYAFGGDAEFLRARAYPQLRELTRMWDARLVAGPAGDLVTPDGWSPEHGPVRGPDGRVTLREGDRTPQVGASYDQQIIWDLFTNFIEASKELGVDAELRAHIVERRERLLGPRIGRWGQIQEWKDDVDDPMNRHRHVSHLFAVHPGRQISPLTTPELARAAGVSLDARGDGGTGWSKAWKICFRARLGEGDRAHTLLGELMTAVPPTRTAIANEGGGVYPNLFCAGPPFQIDGNFGYAAGVAEMLLQSHERDERGQWLIDLLPALPSAWKDGEIRGLRARGGVVVDVAWKDARVTRIRLYAKESKSVKVRVNGQVVTVSTMVGEREIVP